jgi:hypothetical protein
LVAAGQGNERPGIARANRGTATAAGGHPAVEAGAIHLQWACGVGRHCNQLARADQRAHAHPIAAEQLAASATDTAISTVDTGVVVGESAGVAITRYHPVVDVGAG